MQTNEVQNIIIHYSRSANGTLTEVERIPTSGAGSGLFKPISGQKSAPNAFLLVGTTFDLPFALSGTYPDGSPILWIKGARRQMEGDRFQCAGSRRPHRIPRARERYAWAQPRSMMRKPPRRSISPFWHDRPDTFIVGYAVGDGCAMGTIDVGGRINIGPLVKIDTSPGLPSELCWLSVSPDDRMVYATPFGYRYISSYRINGAELSIAKDPACPKVAGDGTARGLNTTVTSGPSDSWISPDGAYLYQIYANASKLLGYATQPDGSLKEITSVKIAYNSPQGLAGF